MLGDIPSLRENWSDAAIFVAPEDAIGLAHAIQQLIGDAALRETLGASARARAKTFTAVRMVESYFSLYRDVRASRAEPASLAS